MQSPPSSVHLHSFPTCQLAALKATFFQAVSLLLLLQNIVYGKRTGRCQGQPVIDSQQLLLLPCSLLLFYWQFRLSTAISVLHCYPSHVFPLWKFEGRPVLLFADLQYMQTLQQHEHRSAAKLVTWDILEKELTWHMWKSQVLAEIFAMINKFHHSKATFCCEYFNGMEASESIFGFHLSFNICHTDLI